MENTLIGASLGGFKGLSMDKAMKLYLKLADEFCVKAVEIRFEKEMKRPSLWPWEASDELESFLQKFEVTGAHLPFTHLNPISPNPKIKEQSIRQLKEAIKKAGELYMDHVVMHARGSAFSLSTEEQFEEWIRIAKEFIDSARENSILLTIENADFLWNLADVVKLVKEINSKWLKITLDIGHAHIRRVAPLSTYPIKDLVLRISDFFLPLSLIKKNMPYEKYGSLKNFIKAEKDLIAVVHVHDYNGRRDHLPVGEGKINFSFLSELKDFKGPYIFEVEFKNHYEDFRKTYNKFMELMNR